MKTIEDALAYADTFDKPANKHMSIVMLAAEVRRLQKEVEKSTAFDWLMAKLQLAYDGKEQSFDGLHIYCRMLYGRRDHRACSAEINFDDVRDEPIGLASAIRKAMQEEENRVQST